MGKGDSHALLLAGLQTGGATLEILVEVFQKVKNKISHMIPMYHSLANAPKTLHSASQMLAEPSSS